MIDWLELDRRHVWHPYTQMATAPPPLPVVAAEGAWLILADGRRVLDGISSWWVTLHGHAHPRIAHAVAAQAARLEQVIFAGCAHEPAARLAAELVRLAPPGLPRVFFSDDGSTAVEVAMKMAVQAWRHRGEPQRTLFVALEGAYHGDTFGAMAAGAQAVFHGAFAGLLCEVRRVPVPGAGVSVAAAVETLERLLVEVGERVAALLVEPIVQAAGGMRFHPPEYLAALRAATARRGIPLVADEIFTGFGRTGRTFACEHAGIAPDLMCVSKGLTGGFLPLAATLASEAIYADFLSADRGRAFFHGHSYTANPIACAAALASIALLDEEACLARVAALERLFAARLARLRGLAAVGAVRGIGGLAVVELAGAAEAGYLDPRGPALQRRLLDRGVLIRPLGSVVYFLPPYCISDEECALFFDAIEEALEEG
ncbi:MAG TPA: adenosylmethionine--8-amino-7-oxononanoate transaminase [Thermoanaerobaculia bacterium]|jgi:adenosylmethionine-8-amino-7-oxononanoate aminotransferase|nr:adenosylmethionine--8-amino-7-oxononanoate transaminase [Thermoanaerobaculia bacterium]